MNSLLIDGQMIIDHGHFWDHVVEFYCALFNKEYPTVDLDKVNFSDVVSLMVLQEENDILTQMPTLEEIKVSIFALNPNSASDPSDFTDMFFLTCWDLIANDLVEAVCYIFCTGHMHFGFNSNFLIPLSKVPDACTMDKFCSIFMGNSLFKISLIS